MGLPEPVSPDPESEQPDDTSSWLVGPEEGLAAEMDRRAAESGFLARPALLRPGTLPGSGASAPATPATPATPPAAEASPFVAGNAYELPPEPGATATPLPRPTLLPPPGAPPAPVSAAPIAPAAPAAPAKRFGAVMPELESGSDFVAGHGMTWEPGARSVPALSQEPRYVPAPEPTRDFPMDDAEERAQARAEALEHAMAAAALASRPHEVVSPEAFNLEAVPMPWYIQLGHVLRTDRRLQVLLGVVLLTLVTIALWPRGDGPMSVNRIRRHPERFDGVNVQVTGKVGQVFQVGGGYAFYLLDGRDTLVVFTRSRVPRQRQHVRVSGTMSNGSLDGQPTLALFETTDGKN